MPSDFKINYAIYGIGSYMNQTRVRKDFDYEAYLKNNSASGDLMKMIQGSGAVPVDNATIEHRNNEGKHISDRPGRSGGGVWDAETTNTTNMNPDPMMRENSRSGDNIFATEMDSTVYDGDKFEDYVEYDHKPPADDMDAEEESSQEGSRSGTRGSNKPRKTKLGSRSEESQETRRINKLMERIVRLETNGIMFKEKLLNPKNIGILEMKVLKYETIENIKAKLATAASFLKGLTWSVEKIALMMKIPSMRGWSDSVMSDQSSYNKTLEQLHDKYLSNIDSPEAQLFALLFQSAIIHSSGMTIINLMADLNHVSQKDRVDRMAKRFENRKMSKPEEDELMSELDEYSKSYSRGG